MKTPELDIALVNAAIDAQAAVEPTGEIDVLD